MHLPKVAFLADSKSKSSLNTEYFCLFFFIKTKSEIYNYKLPHLPFRSLLNCVRACCINRLSALPSGRSHCLCCPHLQTSFLPATSSSNLKMMAAAADQSCRAGHRVSLQNAERDSERLTCCRAREPVVSSSWSYPTETRPGLRVRRGKW